MRRRVVPWMLGAHAVALGILVFIETVQAVFLSERSGNVRDVVTNTTGALIGALCGSLRLRFRRPRSPERLPEAGASLSENSIRS